VLAGARRLARPVQLTLHFGQALQVITMDPLHHVLERRDCLGACFPVCEAGIGQVEEGRGWGEALRRARAEHLPLLMQAKDGR
jgi:hypothetical protein